MAQIRGESIEEEWAPAISMDVEAPPDFIPKPEAPARTDFLYRDAG
jgi:hypothetical protein